jgi:hypothetical protein
MHPAYKAMSRSDRDNFGRECRQAAKTLEGAGWEHLLSAMDDSPRAIDDGRGFGQLFIKGAKRDGTWREFWLNIVTYRNLPVS